MDVKTRVITAITRRIPAVVPYLHGRAGQIYCETKAVDRDPDEPGRDEKMRTERMIGTIVRKRLKRQQEAVIAGLNANYKDIIAPGIFVDDNPAEFNALVILFRNSILQGIGIAEAEVGFALADGSYNEQALAYAREYTTKWLEGLDETTQKALRDALSTLPSNAGTLGDVIDLLEPVFGSERALRIAVTETTRIYAEANQIYANELAKQYPDFKVIKRFYTNVDDRVCPICSPLHLKEADYSDEFAIPNPPLHVSCRCWTSITVKA